MLLWGGDMTMHLLWPQTSAGGLQPWRCLCPCLCMVLFLLLLPGDVLSSAGALQLLLAVSKVGALWLFGFFFCFVLL